jgi:hypothetical protein
MTTMAEQPETRKPITSEELHALARECLNLLRGFPDEGWTRPTVGLEWTCRTTAEHLSHAVDRYCLYLAGPELQRLPYNLVHYDECSMADILRILELRIAALTRIVDASPPGTRAYHVFGLPDPEGYLAMACVELMVHTNDLARSFGSTYQPPAELCARVVARLFPWVPADTDPWQGLEWATGRIKVPALGEAPSDWAWHASPLSEWDGTVKTQASYRRG